MTEQRNTGDGKRVAIVGAGISGLSAAWELAANPELSIDVWERDAEPGGLAGWFQVAGTSLEKFYHHIYRNDYDLINLIRDLDLEDHLVFRATNTGCFYVNSIYRLSSPLDLLKFKPLKFMDRMKMGFLALQTRTVKNWQTLDNMTAKDWMIKMAGEDVYRIIWEPLFRAKFGKFANEVSAAWLWSKFVMRGGSRTKTGREELGYFAGGYGDLFRVLANKLRERGVNIRLNAPVQEVAIRGGEAVGLRADGQEVPYDAVLMTAQMPDFVNLAPGLPASYRNGLKQIEFLANACLVLEMARPLSETYWVNITDVTCPFVGVIEQTNLLGPKYYQGHHLAYLSRYMEPSDPLYAMNADELFATYLPYLQKIFPEFNPDWVVKRYLWRERHAQAVVRTGYLKLIPEHRTPVRKLYLSSMAQIFPEDRQMSNGVKLARRTAKMILEDLA